MKLQILVDALDAQILTGDIIGAFNTYAADKCVTLSNEADKTQSKAQKMEALKWFFNGIAQINRIERPAVQLVSDKVSDSQFVFDFTDHYGNRLVYEEVIRRTWSKDQIVEELYLIGDVLPAESKKPVAKKTAEAKADKKPATKSAEPVVKAKAEKVAKISAPQTETVKAAAPKAKAETVKTKTTETVKASKTSKKTK